MGGASGKDGSGTISESAKMQTAVFKNFQTARKYSGRNYKEAAGSDFTQREGCFYGRILDAAKDRKAGKAAVFDRVLFRMDLDYSGKNTGTGESQILGGRLLPAICLKGEKG